MIVNLFENLFYQEYSVAINARIDCSDHNNVRYKYTAITSKGINDTGELFAEGQIDQSGNNCNIQYTHVNKKYRNKNMLLFIADALEKVGLPLPNNFDGISDERKSMYLAEMSPRESNLLPAA